MGISLHRSEQIIQIAVITSSESYGQNSNSVPSTRNQRFWEAFMGVEKPAYFDLKTVSLMRETPDDAWAYLHPQERETTSRTVLAEAILALAAQGERNPNRLLDAALTAASNRRKADAAA
jgi:hypothetical protein